MDDDRFDWETRHEETPFWHHALAPSSVGIMEHVSMFPVDTVKTRMQVSHGKLGVSKAIHAVLNEEACWDLCEVLMSWALDAYPRTLAFLVSMSTR